MVLLPRIIIAIVLKGISNADLSTMDPLLATVSSVGYGDSVDLIGPQEVQSPPRIFISLCGATGSLVPVTSTTSIDGLFRDGLPIQGGLSNFSTFSNIFNWTKQCHLL